MRGVPPADPFAAGAAWRAVLTAHWKQLLVALVIVWLLSIVLALVVFRVIFNAPPNEGSVRVRFVDGPDTLATAVVPIRRP
jgi:hypothetical protein